MDEYLDLLFGDNEGWVAVASKGPQGWEEKQFKWPAQEGRLLRWVERRVDEANIFICPALRSEERRVKGDGISLGWLWADIDWDKIPEAKRKVVIRRLKFLHPALVNSGTGNNLHVYLRLTREVTVEEHYRLNAGLRDTLMADAKHADNSLLRLPGTFNRKIGAVEVTWRRHQGYKIWDPDELATMDQFKNVQVVDEKRVGDGTYEVVDVSHVRGQAKRWPAMPLDEALGRFGSRHAAVYEVTNKLIRSGLTRDEIHTLMDTFEAGVDKQDDEQGYDLHRDIDRCLARHPTLDQIIKEEDKEDEDDGVLTPLTDEEYEEAIAEEERSDLDGMARVIVKRRKANKLADQIMAHQTFVSPPDDQSGYLSSAGEAEPIQYLVEGLASVGHNVTITGQYKVGKTLFVCNLLRSLAQHEPFLGHQVDDLKDTTVGFWSLEMTKNSLVHGYLNPQGFTQEGKDSIYMFHGRGYSINLLHDVGRKWAIDWLSREDVGVWVIDSFARIVSMAGVDPNDNGEVLHLLQVLDGIKREAGVSEMFLIAHTGRSEVAKDRARGATVFDDWADARWILSKEGDVRFLKVEGRDVDLPNTSLSLDEETRHLSLGTMGREGIRDQYVQSVVSLVAQHPGAAKMTLIRLVKELGITGYRDNYSASQLIEEAVDLGFIRKEKVGGRGGKLSFTVVADGERRGKGGGSVRTLDFSKVREHQAKVKKKRPVIEDDEG